MNDVIRDRIKKLLALSLSDNPNEAALAAQKAVELMNTYGVSEADLEDNPFCQITIERKYYRLPIWAQNLWCQLGYASGCFVVYSNGHKGRYLSDIPSKITIAGKKTDVEIMRYMGEFFESEINKKIKKQGKEFNGNKTAFNRYKEGLASGIAFKIRDSQKVFFEHHKSNGAALVAVDTKSSEARDWFISLEGKVKTAALMPKTEEYLRGVKDAQDISINKAMNGGNDFIALAHKL